MNGVVRRIGVVAWWVGTPFAAGALALLAYAFTQLPRCRDGNLFTNDCGVGVMLGVAVFLLLITAGLWALAFVLAGSFWRPARPDR